MTSLALPLAIALGGAIGAALRFVVDGEVKARTAVTWPLATLVINVLGSFVLGAAFAADIGTTATAFGATGVCGGFTTFSTASVETLALLRARRAAVALVYALCSAVTCVAAVVAGAALIA